ncbi:MAG: endopeptidase La [Clostridia bacterium]|nr:endopeptidase La [Clostridia bacterium]
MPRKKETTKTYPLIPLRGLMVFPRMILHFDVGRAPSVSALEKAMMQDQLLVLAVQRDEEKEDPAYEDLWPVGMLAQIKQVISLPGDALRVLVEGKERVLIRSIETVEESTVAVCAAEIQDDSDPLETEALYRSLRSALQQYIDSGASVSPDTLRAMSNVRDAEVLTDQVAANILTKYEDRLDILQEIRKNDRAQKLILALMRETALTEVERSVQARLKKLVDKNQKDYYLREQIRAIQEELGDLDQSLTEDLRAKAAKLPLNDEAKDRVERELNRMDRMPSGTPEIVISQTYVEWILDLPWGKYTQDNLDIKRARKILDEDHYGLKKVKERIIEYLAVLALRHQNEEDPVMRGPILCFVGPPGVGKTSIVRAVAKAINRKFVQMSLGGVRDEAEIRGHRRTYIGALPGRIISGIKQAGSMNPVFLFDEIDKMSSDFRGDPASAMLEVLDAEQNNAFRDHYLELPFDLSRVMFITTANTRESIPEPLLDRMEIIEVPSYTEEEKLQIAKRHLVRKEAKEYGIPAKAVHISDSVLKRVIEDYTREAGVRILTRTIGQIIRKCAVDMLEKDKKSVTVTLPLMREYLGAARYLRDLPEKKPIVGVVNGLAYTAVGGEMLAVECSVLKGSGVLELTGKLGDVMKESAHAARSWVRVHAEEFKLAEDFYKTNDIHIHVPEGAVPKDGPSAGVTITTAMVSALTGRAVRQDVAMTGEITLRGRVLPIGGVKEKVLAAYRAGIKTLILPRENEKDLEDVPPYVQETFRIVYADGIMDVLREALVE